MNLPISTRTQAERADQTRARILDAAVRQFSENGLAGARTEQIAEDAGVNKALLYYYYKSKDALYAAAMEHVVEGVRVANLAIFEANASAGERFLLLVLYHFDRIHSNPGFQSLMQQEMMRLRRGEGITLSPLVEKVFRPMMQRMLQVIEEGIASGELIAADPSQIQIAAFGANVFYFLSAPLMRLMQGSDPLEIGALELRRSAAIRYLGQALFVDRIQGARIAESVLAATPMPENSGTLPSSTPEFHTKRKQD